MCYVVHAVYYFLSLVPGLAARTHRPSGRMGAPLRAVTATAGALFVAGGLAVGAGAWRGFQQGLFGYFPAIVIVLVAAFLLAGGGAAVRRAVRNPAPPSAPNVIQFHRSADFEAPDLHRYRRWKR